MKVPSFFYSQTAGMESLIFCLSILFGVSLSQITDLWIGICGMLCFTSAFCLIEKWNNPRKPIPVWRRS